jgi:hypothetical protein
MVQEGRNVGGYGMKNTLPRASKPVGFANAEVVQVWKGYGLGGQKEQLVTE